MKLKHILTLSVGIFLVGCRGGDLAEHKCHYKTKVVEVGQCGGGEGFFDGNRECSISYTQEGVKGLFYGKVYGGAMKGQELFKLCWRNDKDRGCFRTQRTVNRDSYSESCEVIRTKKERDEIARKNKQKP